MQACFGFTLAQAATNIRMRPELGGGALLEARPAAGYAGDVSPQLAYQWWRSGEAVLQLKPHEFVRDYDNNYYGLLIYLGKNESLPLRLYMDAAQQRPGPVTP